MRQLLRGDNEAVGNVIQRHSRWARARSPGIFWAGVGNRFMSNHIIDTPDMAICKQLLSYLRLWYQPKRHQPQWLIDCAGDVQTVVAIRQVQKVVATISLRAIL